MNLIQAYSKELISIFVPIVLALIGHVFKARSKIIWSVTNAQVMSVQENRQAPGNGEVQQVPGTVRTASIFFRNTGRDAATNVEIVFNWKPAHFNVWPQRDYNTITNPDGRFIIKLDDLAPKENFGVELLAVNEVLPDVVSVRSTQGVGKLVKTMPDLVHPKWQLVLVLYLMFAGAIATVYALISTVQLFAFIQ